MKITQARRGALARRGRARDLAGWVREEGLAYECTCPMGVQQQFCKHTVAIALAHLDQQRREAERELSLLRRRVMAVDPMVLVDRLLDHARTDPNLAAVLKQLTRD